MSSDQVIENLPTRTPRVAAEFRVIQVMETPIALRDIGGCRACSAFELIT